MRISEEERRTIVDSVTALDPDARVWLFGSRVDDAKRGGDIDIAILSRRIGKREARLVRRAIEDGCGEQGLDIVWSTDGHEAFFRLALEEGLPLDAKNLA